MSSEITRRFDAALRDAFDFAKFAAIHSETSALACEFLALGILRDPTEAVRALMDCVAIDQRQLAEDLWSRTELRTSLSMNLQKANSQDPIFGAYRLRLSSDASRAIDRGARISVGEHIRCEDLITAIAWEVDRRSLALADLAARRLILMRELNTVHAWGTLGITPPGNPLLRHLILDFTAAARSVLRQSAESAIQDTSSGINTLDSRHIYTSCVGARYEQLRSHLTLERLGQGLGKYLQGEAAAPFQDGWTGSEGGPVSNPVSWDDGNQDEMADLLLSFRRRTGDRYVDTLHLLCAASVLERHRMATHPDQESSILVDPDLLLGEGMTVRGDVRLVDRFPRVGGGVELPSTDGSLARTSWMARVARFAVLGLTTTGEHLNTPVEARRGSTVVRALQVEQPAHISSLAFGVVYAWTDNWWILPATVILIIAITQQQWSRPWLGAVLVALASPFLPVVLTISTAICWAASRVGGVTSRASLSADIGNPRLSEAQMARANSNFHKIMARWATSDAD